MKDTQYPALHQKTAVILLWKLHGYWEAPSGSVGKQSAWMQKTEEMQFRSLGWEDPLEEEMAIHSSIPAWKISWTEESVQMATKSQTHLSN